MENISILLGKEKSADSVNEENKISLDLERDMRPLGNNSLVDTFSEEEQYVKENDESNKYRLIFTINPICTNVLFNSFTEIVYNEGGEDCISFREEYEEYPNIPETMKEYLKNTKRYNDEKWKTYLKRSFLIKDTAYSHSEIGPLVYHCGYDIFNNHTLRQKITTSINRLNTSENCEPENFNTLADTERDLDSYLVTDNIVRQDELFELHWDNNEVGLHKYTRNDVYSFKESIRENLIEKNGWIGFENKMSIPTENYISGLTKLTLNKTMNNNKSCEFIDMYPDRSLYSFIPKENKFRNRLEKNWDYCLTYPCEKDEEHLLVKANDVSGNTIFNGLQSYVYAYDIWKDENDVSHLYEDGTITLSSYIKHNLNVGDKVKICVFFNDLVDGVYYKILPFDKIEVIRLGYAGDDEEHKFAIKTEWLQEYLLPEGSGTTKIVDIRFAKIVDGVQCDYYLRKFKALNEDDFSNSLNRLAFSRNIYGDQEAQIVYNDDIDTTGLTDYLNRPLSEIYLTIIKRNKGWKEWYLSGNTSGETVEYSHCFGKITEGLDLTEEVFDYNVHTIHNVEITKDGEGKSKIGGYDNVWDIIYSKSLTEQEEGITYEGLMNGETVYGDLVEFHPSTYTETIIEEVYQRFNTVQREYTSNDDFVKMTYDEITSNDREIKPKKNVSGEPVYSASTFEVKTYEFTTNEEIDSDTNMPLYRINISPEGYFYKPHYRIKLKEFENTVNIGSHTKIYYEIIESGETEYTIRALKSTIELNEEISKGIPYPNRCKDYYLELGDTLYLYNSKTGIRNEAEIIKIEGDLNERVTFEINEDNFIFDSILLPNPEIPLSAYEYKDGSGKYTWRDFKSCNEIEEGSELYERVFTNGAHYVHKNINFYLKRQDPTGKYGLSIQDGDYQELSSLIVKGEELDVDTLESAEEKNNSGTC